MKLYAPAYYQTFKCIADKCRHSCCVGWEIDIDDDALEAYKALKNGYGAVIRESISMEDTPHFKLGDHDRCPHLDERGLCRIILNLGEDHLCDICREHPRFYNFTDVAEVGLGMSCEEAARIILSFPQYDVLEEIGELPVEDDRITFDGRAERSKIYAILRDGSENYTARLAKIYLAYGISSGNDAAWLEKIESLEYLDESHKSLFLNYSSESRPEGKDEYPERFLGYFIYRHCTEALDAEDFSARLGFCLFCERLFASLIHAGSAETLEEVVALARIISEEIEYSPDNTVALTD